MTPRAHLAALALATVLIASPAAADRALDTIFDAQQLQSVETGTAHRFDYDRINPAVQNPPVEGGSMTLEIEAMGDKRVATVEIDDGQRSRQLENFPGDAGNPLLLVFLENVARGVSEGTGGSPFYIRNRIKDAFRAGAKAETVEADLNGKTIAAERFTYTPFAREAQVDRLGIFADLQLSFMMSDAVPGGVMALGATSGDGKDAYRETIAYAGTETEQ